MMITMMIMMIKIMIKMMMIVLKTIMMISKLCDNKHNNNVVAVMTVITKVKMRHNSNNANQYICICNMNC
jgi:hypothetical protein